MAYDEGLATRLRDLLPALTEKRMFGGLAFLLNGNMTVGILGEALIVRLDVDEAADALTEPGARPFDFTGRPMKGWLMVDPEGHAEDDDLCRWVDRAIDFVGSLPPKAP
ncbi:RNA methyltransferase [Kibdelosporangium aridum]|uniref:RNA methyltransferase n=1 Tax=Kibdelosporangium aridum TaxID=2030 RepID=A0A428ZIN2_KIBAR|nr:TfoX/Sxy family protein [Kibdelosporangium aridum]RSM87939.1 RNA methyltransferase [Kibdelosporangium aridum]